MIATGLSRDDTFLAFDIATNCGWCVLSGDTYRTGEMACDNPKRLSIFRSLVVELTNRHRPAVVLAEDVFINPNPSTKTLLYMHGQLLQLMEQYTGLFSYVPQATAKAFVAGNGKMTSKQKKAGAMRDALIARGYDVKGLDAADALAIALTGRNMLTGAGL